MLLMYFGFVVLGYFFLSLVSFLPFRTRQNSQTYPVEVFPLLRKLQFIKFSMTPEVFRTNSRCHKILRVCVSEFMRIQVAIWKDFPS